MSTSEGDEQHRLVMISDGYRDSGTDDHLERWTRLHSQGSTDDLVRKLLAPERAA